MLNIQNELLSNLAIQDIDIINKDIYEIKLIIDKYHLESNNSLPVQLNEISAQILLEHLIELYMSDKNISEDIEYIVEHNSSFRLYLNVYIQNRMKNIIDNPSTIVYKELYILINLLSMGKSYNIFSHYSFYSIEAIKQLFNTYETKLIELHEHNKPDDFNLLFFNYFTLIDVLIELCVINDMDLKRKSSIEPITHAILESISRLSNSVTLEDNKVSLLNNIKGEILLYFSDISYVQMDSGNIDIVLEKYVVTMSKMLDGYRLVKSKNTQPLNDKYYDTFWEKITTLMLTVIFKIEHLEASMQAQTVQNSNFVELITIYNKVSKEKLDNQNNLFSLKEHLLDNYLTLYNKSLEKSINTYSDIIDSFIDSKEFNLVSMQVLHNMVLFDTSVKVEKLEQVLKVLIEKPRYNNDFHEFYKLKIIDVILNIYHEKEIKSNHFKEVVAYINTNKVASHLIGSYSKIYLTLCLYFSKYSDEASNLLSKEYYSLYVKIDNDNILEHEYLQLHNKILKNYGTYYLKSVKSLHLIDVLDIILIGRKDIQTYLENHDLKIRDDISSRFSAMIEEILNNSIQSFDMLTNEIEQLVSTKIFYGLVNISISKDNMEHFHKSDLGYEKKVYQLNEEYQLEFNYSKSYTQVFNLIFENNIEYLTKRLSNIINAYEKSLPSFNDPITELPNIIELKKRLSKNDEIVFIELYNDSLVNMNRKMNYAKSNQYFKAVCQVLKNISDNIYRLTGPRVAIISNVKEYKEIVEQIRHLEVTFNEQTLKVQFTVAVSFGQSSTILDKSHYCLSSAMLSEKKYHEFK